MSVIPPLSARDIAIRQAALAGAQLNTARMQAVGGEQWTVIERTDNGITASAETPLGTITAFVLAPTPAGVVAGPGSTFVEREKWVMLVETAVIDAFELAADTEFKRGLIVQSVDMPTMRLQVRSRDETDSPLYLRAELEPV